jgi:hypothetical protein
MDKTVPLPHPSPSLPVFLLSLFTSFCLSVSVSHTGYFPQRKQTRKSRYITKIVPAFMKGIKVAGVVGRGWLMEDDQAAGQNLGR